MTNVKVKAIENGHDGVQYRNAGEVFEIDKGRLKDGSTWFVKLADAPAEADDIVGADASTVPVDQAAEPPAA
ncbi:MAG TPA: hypothetical protein VFN69_04360 [Rudaea sp.]|nr:hypothetical protein [Rudaea sp.]